MFCQGKHFLLIVLVISLGCDRNSRVDLEANGAFPQRASSVNDSLNVTVTVGMLADLVSNVGGSRVAVTQLCGSGVDPHLYKLTRDDVLAIRQADLVLYAGLLLEGRMTDTLVREARKRPVIAVTEAIDEMLLQESEGFGGHFDPHVWMDVSVWLRCVDVVARELSSMAPGGTEYFQRNAHDYKAELDRLHRYGIESIATIPVESRVLVTSHDAFNYFGRVYGLEVHGVQGISTESEAGLRRINELVELLVTKDVRTVFVESSVSSDSLEALVEGANARGGRVRIGAAALFSDAMGEPGSYEGTYVGMLDHNITHVTRGLGGSVPERGLNGKLKTR